MKKFLIIIAALQLCIFVKSTEIDPKYLRCLVCRATIDELKTELGKIDPSIEIEVGNYRMDAKGNSITKKVSKARSEIHISETIDEICEKMSDYVRATYKTNGQLTILNLMSSSGVMNPEMSKVDLIQDNDLNKSLKYYCEGIVEEFEEPIISLFSKGETMIRRKLCTDIAKICDSEDFLNEDGVNNNEDNKIEINDEL
ncbi:protein seele-like [Vespa mandarinia]|uniref:protein seele-like n=1 Tax=Vespa mandarinia TaxID=7446 RepID=UPI00161F5661|nr:protein seele-like [Vespa mandarinia]